MKNRRISRNQECDLIVVGSGVAGLMCALGAAPLRVTLLTKSQLGLGGSSSWAQGGVAAAVGSDDSPELHAADTLAVGGGLSNRNIVSLLTREGPALVRRLIELGTRFDTDLCGQLRLGREAAHSRNRVIHAGGDATGAEIIRALTSAVRNSRHVTVREQVTVRDLAVDNHCLYGVIVETSAGEPVLLKAPRVVLASGGIGHLYLHTTNPPESTGDGLAMAARAGVRLTDLEFVQFHPTALAVEMDPLPLLTEAIRGEGAILVNQDGVRFMLEEHPLAELAPRDVVARAIWRRLSSGGRVFLDARESVADRFPSRFPGVFQRCLAAGIDPRVDRMPVCPAAHYHIGGIAVDSRGRSSLAGLWACGEVAATGVHGANRLASNSLLEALVFGARVSEDLLSAGVGSSTPGRERSGREALHCDGGNRNSIRRQQIRKLMWDSVGLVREEKGLLKALQILSEMEERRATLSAEEANMVLVGRLIARAALLRRESRGVHFRSDFPKQDSHWQRHQFLNQDATPQPAVAGSA